MNAKLSGIKKHFPKLVMTVAMLLSFLPASAYDFEVDGIYYNVTNTLYDEVEVTWSYIGGTYSGDVNIPSSVTYKGTTFKVTSIGDWAFQYCKNMTSITLPSSLTSIGDWAFFECHDLTSITIPNSVTYIGEHAFQSCTGLTRITIPNSVTYIRQSTFSACSSLRSVTIPNSVTSIGDDAFGNCYSLTSVTIPNSVTSIGNGAFFSCKSFTSVTIPNSVTYIGHGAFQWCTNLVSITIPNSVTYIGYCAFNSCSITSVTIPSSVTHIGYSPFIACSNLTTINVDPANKSYASVDGVLYNKNFTKLIQYPNGKPGTTFSIPNSVTHIGICAFRHSPDLTSISIPNSVTSIGNGAFDSCPLKSVYCHWEVPISISYEYPDVAVFSVREATLYVPKGCSKNYSADFYWGNFENIVEVDYLGVEDILENRPAGGYVVYDLQGVLRLKTADMDEVKQLPAGLYIVNGKKMIIR